MVCTLPGPKAQAGCMRGGEPQQRAGWRGRRYLCMTRKGNTFESSRNKSLGIKDYRNNYRLFFVSKTQPDSRNSRI